MLRERIDEYLDGLLDPAGVRELEATLAQEPKAAKLLSQMKAERALRTAAYESYKPTPVESSAMAARLLDEAYHAPLGRVGRWIRHGSAVAAAVLVVAGSFLAGHMTAPTQTAPQIVYKTDIVYQQAPQKYVVALKDAQGRTISVSDELLQEQVQQFVDFHSGGPTVTSDEIQQRRGGRSRTGSPSN